MGDAICQVFHRGQDGTTGDTIVFRSSESEPELVCGGRTWSLEGNGELFRQPMRFLLADDPGAGKTIMAGLLIKELRIRGELERCLIVAPLLQRRCT